MLKRFFLAVLFAGLLSPVFASGTIPYSLSQQLDSLGKPLSGCKLYTIQAGTTSTPQNAYQDSALTLALPNPQTCDAAGRLPQFFLADGSIKVRLTDRNGVTQVVADGILVIGPSGGGGGGSTVDATTVLATGDVKYRYSTGALSGFVRANGRTIGSATSGATERANADTQALFEYLWSADSNLTVSSGRGASANADWVANKTIVLPDFRGRVLASPSAMGSSDSGRLGSGAGSYGANNDTLGFAGGSETHGLTLAQLPAGITSSGSNSITVNSSVGDVIRGAIISSGAAGGANAQLSAGATGNTISSVGTNAIAVTSNNTFGAVHDTMSPSILVTTYIKL